MTAYFDAAAREVTAYAAAFKEDEGAFLRAIGWLEAGIIRDVTRLTGDREFPDDLREQILGDIVVWRIDAGELPETEGRRSAREFHCSELIERLHDRFHELARRRVVTRFGLLADDPLQSLMLRQEWESERATHFGADKPLCGRSLVDGIPLTAERDRVSCWVCQLRLGAEDKESAS